MSHLETRGLSLSFGGIQALDGVDLDVPPAEIRGIIGPNGAGKTTLLNAICGLTPPSAGQVLLDGEVISGLKPSAIAAKGVGRTFQTSMLFSGMTVLENVMTGLHQHMGANVFTAALGLPSVRQEDADAREKALAALDFVNMRQFAERDGGALSFGQQRLIEIARALVSQPSVLLLDEPAVGLSPPRVQELDRLLRRIRDERGITIVMIEHVIRLVMGVCDRITVLNSGAKIAEGTGDEIIANREVQEAYLGKAIDAAD
ncbi:ABC transporter ATP-binding protein [Futiania mangrovi]|uniref:ABC transporter ATP-binding protein n=1 Tax=Futiania mangrovi TaxID=2959716 RepID=A0A9J6PGI6_9PROT|nr:ABC transporter ATP-binding protein [Futiania mangrovii]MCP1337857.1 ABC transporter ATP-binding protein [Futiania mangrovii]